MLGKLEEIHKKYLELEKQINDPDAMSDMKRYIQLSKDHKELQPIVAAYKNYRNVMTSLDAAKEILEKEKDEEMRAYAKEELFELSNQRDQMEEEHPPDADPGRSAGPQECCRGDPCRNRR